MEPRRRDGTKVLWVGILVGVVCFVGALWGAGEAATKPGVQVYGWRGDGSGFFPGADPPTTWDSDAKKNVRWSAAVGKSLYNSPIVAGGKVFLLAEPDTVLCLDGDTGKELWSKGTGVGDLPEKVELVPVNEAVGTTTPCPVTDGQAVYAAFADGLVTAFELDGKRRWVKFIGEQCPTGNGRAASVCLSGDKLIVSLGSLTALDVKTGKQVWKAEKVAEVYGSPVAARVGEKAVIVSSTGQIVDAADGTVLAKGLGETTYTTPLVAKDKVYFVDDDAYGAPLTAKDAAGKKIWSQDLDGDFFASPVICDGLIYAPNNQGHLYVLDAADGKIVYNQLLPIASAGGESEVSGNVYPSVCLAGGHVFISNDQGETVVLEPGREYKQIALNKIDDVIAGSYAFAGKRIYVRARGRVYCLEKR